MAREIDPELEQQTTQLFTEVLPLGPEYVQVGRMKVVLERAGGRRQRGIGIMATQDAL